jgi:hypothetical protein
MPQASFGSSDCMPQPTDSADVWFLAGGSGGSTDEHVVEVHCTVPAGRYLMLGVPALLCSDVVPTPGFATSATGLRRCARSSYEKYTDPHPRLVLDGQPIPAGVVVHTPVFRFTMPAHDNVFDSPGVRRGRAASVGRAAMLRPLPPGSHTLISGVRYRITHNIVIVYKLDVV